MDDPPLAPQFWWAVKNGNVGLLMLTTDQIPTTGNSAYSNLDCGGAMTPLFLACSLGYADIMHILCGYGFDIDQRFDGETILQAAAAGGHLTVVDKLLTAGAHVNVPAAGSSDRTTLHAAAAGGHLAVVDLLLLASAHLSLPAGSC